MNKIRKKLSKLYWPQDYYLKLGHKKKLRGLGPRANYTERAAAAGRRS